MREIKTENVNGVRLVHFPSNHRWCWQTFCHHRKPIQQLGNLTGISVGSIVRLLGITKAECDPR